jgi:hypothetical protein
LSISKLINWLSRSCCLSFICRCHLDSIIRDTWCLLQVCLLDDFIRVDIFSDFVMIY